MKYVIGDLIKMTEGDHRNYRLKLGDRVIIVDGIDLTTNTVYEFWW